MSSEPWIDKEILDLMLYGTPEDRIYIGYMEPAYFMLYHFTEYIKFDFAPFHKDFFQDLKDFRDGNIDEAAWIAFRESAKTSIAKTAGLTWMGCYNIKNYIAAASFDKSNAESILYDVSINFQTNNTIIQDFGQLYYSDGKEKRSERKRLGDFNLENGVSFEAFTTQKSPRGRLRAEQRPDFWLLDDIENNLTKDSIAKTSKVIDFINEMTTGAAGDAGILYLGNYLTDIGSVAYVLERLERMGDRARVRNITITDPKEQTLAWPAKYVWTDKDAQAINQFIEDRKRHVISIESRKRKFGAVVYATEFMNNPAAAGDNVFDRYILKEMKANAKEPREVVAGVRVYEPYRPGSTYCIGVDVSQGVSQDSSTMVILDLTQQKLVAAFASDTFDPIDIAELAVEWAKIYGNALIVPEVNDAGYATVAHIVRQLKYYNVYKRRTEDKATGKAAVHWGFKTTGGTKPKIIAALAQSIMDSDLEILDATVITELYNYTKPHLRETKTTEGTTRHFDLVMALAFAWEGRIQAQFKKDAREKRKDKSRLSPHHGQKYIP